MCVCYSLSHVQLFRGPMDCSSPGSSVHGILQTRILEWVVIPSSRGSFRPRDQAHISYIDRGYLVDTLNLSSLLHSLPSLHICSVSLILCHYSSRLPSIENPDLSLGSCSPWAFLSRRSLILLLLTETKHTLVSFYVMTSA